MKKTFLLIFALSVTICGYSQEFEMHNGDLLFQENGSNAFTDAIVNVTKSVKEYNFSHVGVAYNENGEWYVLEAIPYGVSKTPLASFFKKSKQLEGKPVVLVGRVKKRYEKIIPSALEDIKKLVGKRYDMEFDPMNDMYYCSEIIYISYLRGGKPIFKSAPMTFKNKATGEMSPLWIKHFERLKKPIPEGVEGTNPGDMSCSKKIKIVHNYLD